MAKVEGVYPDGRGGWYYKATLGRDPLTGKRQQVTKRGFKTAGQALRARRELIARQEERGCVLAPAALTVNQLLDAYLDAIDADGRLGVKTRFDYRSTADGLIRPHLGNHRVREITPQVVNAWQRALAERGSSRGRPLSPNSVRLARAPLAGAFKMAVAQGLVAVDPIAASKRPTKRKSVPHHWTPEQARLFLDLRQQDREWPVWAFLLGCGLRIGELVALRWPNVDLVRKRAIIAEFSTTLGYLVVPSGGKSSTATRSVDLDAWLVTVLERQRAQQARDATGSPGYSPSDFVFTCEGGGPYHPQTLSKALGRLSESSGLPRLTAHGLRHTSATLMLDSGVHSKVAAERLGHADPSLFLALYSHVTPTMQRDAAAKVGAALSADMRPPVDR